MVTYNQQGHTGRGVQDVLRTDRWKDRLTDRPSYKNPKVRSPTELIMDPFEEGGVLRVRVVRFKFLNNLQSVLS